MASDDPPHCSFVEKLNVIDVHVCLCVKLSRKFAQMLCVGRHDNLSVYASADKIRCALCLVNATSVITHTCSTLELRKVDTLIKLRH